MQIWMVYALTAVVFWGVWGFFGKLASRSLSAPVVLLLGSIGGMLTVGLFCVASAREMRFEWLHRDALFALIGGIVGTVGGLFFYLALGKGEASRVMAITAVYPGITLLLAWVFLGEQLTPQKAVGFACAMAGVYLLSK